MYQLTDENIIVRIADGAAIPMDAGNADYVKYLDWLGMGGAPLPVPLPAEHQPTVAQQIEALLQEAGETRLTIQMVIQVCEDKAKAQAPELGMTDAQALAYAYSKNKAYRVCKDLEARIRNLEKSNADD